MDNKQYQLLSILADGDFHSGESLGTSLDMGRSAVWKHIKALESLGLDIYAVPGRGYRLSEPVGLLSREMILANISADARRRISGLDIHSSIGSTNTELMNRAALGLASGFICMSEHQEQGRGRRGRQWLSPFASNLYLSVLWHFSSIPQSLASLSLATAVAVLRALRNMGTEGVMLKWPNDIYWQERKLAGVLLEMSGEASGPCQVVLGIGLDVNMQSDEGAVIDQPWASLREIHGKQLDRNLVAAAVLEEVMPMLALFEQQGFQPFQKDWYQHDLLRGRDISIQGEHHARQGRAHGLDESGALLVKFDDGIEKIHSGEVSIRL